MSIRTLVIPIEAVLALADLPDDARVVSYGAGARDSEESQGEVESIYVHLESAEFKEEDHDKPLALK
ncbi:MAG TPA: hypothetical protein VJU84_08560 [Pyrinomonadaceae bacterium]|nr:hypothetical protein [Pyrinomonadaceae bacterium]